jgi:hypothetical protein
MIDYMAKLSSETLATIWSLIQKLSLLVEDATETEYILFERFGETDETIAYLEELKNVAIESASRYSQLTKLRLRIAEAQPTIARDTLKLLEDSINQNQLRIPAMERSIQEIKLEWNL